MMVSINEHLGKGSFKKSIIFEGEGPNYVTIFFGSSSECTEISHTFISLNGPFS